MKSNQKIIVVACPLGRTGSSAMMGLLKLAGVDVGNENNFRPPAPSNPKGFFELPSQHQLLIKAFEGALPEIPPSFDKLHAVGQKYNSEYLEFLDKEFVDFDIIAIKSPRMLTLPILWQFRNQFDIRVLVMSRNIEDQARSIIRIWKTLDDPIKNQATEEDVKQWLSNWMEFSSQVQRQWDFQYLPVSFDTLLEKPFSVMQTITNFIGIQCPTEREINMFLDPNLVNRKTLPADPNESLKVKVMRNIMKVKPIRQTKNRFNRWLSKP